MKTCLALHLHHQDLWLEYKPLLKNLKDSNTDVFVTVNTTDTLYYRDIKLNVDDVFVVENKGMDFGGFLFCLDKIKDQDYNLVTKLHGKKHQGYAYNSALYNAELWRRSLYNPLIKTKERYDKIVEAFRKDPLLFMAGSEQSFRTEETGNKILLLNKHFISTLLNLLEIPETPFQCKFIAGSMFTVSKKYLDMLFKNKEMEIYNQMQTGYSGDGTIAHALERIVGSAVSVYNGKFAVV